MALAHPKQITFEEFIAWYPENSERRYELHCASQKILAEYSTSRVENVHPFNANK